MIASKSSRYESQFIPKVSVRCVFDRPYQENWLEQVTTKKGQSNWSIASLCSELVAKMAKDIGMTIRKGIVVPFLPCLVAFWGFHPYMFLKCFFVTCHTIDYTRKKQSTILISNLHSYHKKWGGTKIFKGGPYFS